MLFKNGLVSKGYLYPINTSYSGIENISKPVFWEGGRTIFPGQDSDPPSDLFSTNISQIHYLPFILLGGI